MKRWHLFAFGIAAGFLAATQWGADLAYVDPPRPPQYIYQHTCDVGDYLYDTNGNIVGTPQCCNRKMILQTNED